MITASDKLAFLIKGSQPHQWALLQIAIAESLEYRDCLIDEKYPEKKAIDQMQWRQIIVWKEAGAPSKRITRQITYFPIAFVDRGLE